MPRVRPARAVLPSALLLVAAATLVPVGGSRPEVTRECLLLCGDQGLADFLVNVVLYTPLGIGLALWKTSLALTALSGLGVSAVIEALQIVIPGRDAHAGDIVANGLGTMLGWALTARRHLWLTPAPEHRERYVLAWAAIVCAIIGGTGVLLQPQLPPGIWWAHWTPRFGHLEAYDGTVLTARIGPYAVEPGALARTPAVRTMLASGVPLEVAGILGPSPASAAPLFGMTDSHQRAALMVLVEERDLIVDWRLRAAGLRLRGPSGRVRGWAGTRIAGDTVRLTVRHSPDAGLCVEDAGSRHCALEPPITRGWSLFYWVGGALPGAAAALDVFWITLLTVPLGLWRFAGGSWTGTVVAVWLFMPVAGSTLGLGTAPVTAFAGVAAGLATGLWLHRRLAA